jgi:hypothetical protein
MHQPSAKFWCKSVDEGPESDRISPGKQLTMNVHQAHQLSIDRSQPEGWTVTIGNPPVNVLDQGANHE